MEFKYTCLIVDDEYPAHDVIKALLVPFPNLEFVKSCYNGEDAIEEINGNFAYDIIFLDINMPIINGIEMISKLKTKPVIVVTTAYTSFAFDAYENDAIDYLQKPISSERFEKAIEKAIEICQIKKNNFINKIVLKEDGLKLNFQENEIIYLESMGNYTKFFLQNRPKPILLNEPLSKQIEKLNNNLFLRIHKTFIVNKTFIAGKKANILILNNQKALPIGRKFYPMVNLLKLSK